MTKVRDLFKTHSGGLADVHGAKPDGETPKDITILEEKYRYFKRKSETWRAEMAKNEKFRNGLQWTKEQIKELARRRQAPIVVNLIAPSVDQLKAMLTANDPRFNGLPREGSDRKTAMLFSDIFSWIWYFNRGNKKLRLTVDNYTVRGLGYMMPWWDPEADFGKGEVIIESVNPSDVYVDPNSQEPLFEDAETIMVVRDYTAEQVQQNLRISASWLKNVATSDLENDMDFNSTDVPQIETDIDGSDETVRYRVMDAYSYMLRKYFHYHYEEYENNIDEDARETFEKTPVLRLVNTDLQSGQAQTTWMVEEDEIGQWQQMIEQFGTLFHFVQQEDPETGEIIEQPVPGPPTGPEAVRQMELSTGTIADMLAEGVMTSKEYNKQEVYRRLVIGDKIYWKGWTGLTIIPLIPFPNRHNRNPYPVSDVTLTSDLQKELNKIRSTILTHAANTASVKVALPRGSSKKGDVEEELQKAGVSVIEYEAIDGAGPHFMYPPQLPSHFYQSEEKIRETIYEVFGIYPFMQGGGGGHSTSSGILIMDEFAQRRIASKRTEIEESLNQLAKVVMQLIQNHYTEEKTIRIVQPSGRYNEVNLNSPVYDNYSGRLLHRINDVTLGRYDVIVASGSTLPSNRITRLEYFMKLYEAGLIDQYEVLKNIDEVDVEGVLDRMGLLQQLQAQLAEMEEEVKKLSGDLQTADREAVSARKRLEVEKFKAQLATMRAAVDKHLNVAKEKEMSGFREGLSERTRDQGEGGPAGPSPVILDEQLYEQVNQM